MAKPITIFFIAAVFKFLRYSKRFIYGLLSGNHSNYLLPPDERLPLDERPPPPLEREGEDTDRIPEEDRLPPEFDGLE
jgi:hypothetical protein